MNEIDRGAGEAKSKLRESVTQTKSRFSSYVVTREEAKAEGGLTEEEVSDLFQGGE